MSYGHAVHVYREDSIRQQQGAATPDRGRRCQGHPVGSIESDAEYPGGVDFRQRHEGVDGPPGWHIHQLVGDRAGTWSISASGNWRITFDIEEGEISNLDLEDYH